MDKIEFFSGICPKSKATKQIKINYFKKQVNGAPMEIYQKGQFTCDNICDDPKNCPIYEKAPQLKYE